MDNTWEVVNATPCTEEEIAFLVQKAIEYVRDPSHHGKTYSMMGNTLVLAYLTYDGAIEIEVTERKRTITIRNSTGGV